MVESKNERQVGVLADSSSRGVCCWLVGLRATLWLVVIPLAPITSPPPPNPPSAGRGIVFFYKKKLPATWASLDNIHFLKLVGSPVIFFTILDQKQLIILFAALADAISAHENASTRVKGIEQQKPKNTETASRFGYKELEAVAAWEERMNAATSELANKEKILKETQEQFLGALPDAIKKRLHKNTPIIIGEGNSFLGLYQRGKELAILSGQHEQSLYSEIYSYYQQRGREIGNI